MSLTLTKDTVQLKAPGASACIALMGAEPTSWRVADHELVWEADPAHWSRHAPILFPVVGASTDGVIRLGGQRYPMPQHGFARDSTFTLVDKDEHSARLRLTESNQTWAHFPFRFELNVAVTLTSNELELAFEVRNAHESDMPYALGFHPAFRWPFDTDTPAEHTIVFQNEENPEVRTITNSGLLSRQSSRRLPLNGRRLALDPDLFTTALVFLEARSRALRFASPSGASIELETDDFPHLALWTKPHAPFLSMEAWTGHADFEGFAGDLTERASMRRLRPGQSARHVVTLRWHAT